MTVESFRKLNFKSEQRVAITKRNTDLQEPHIKMEFRILFIIFNRLNHDDIVLFFDVSFHPTLNAFNCPKIAVHFPDESNER